MVYIVLIYQARPSLTLQKVREGLVYLIYQARPSLTLQKVREGLA